ncbi:MAG TPA: carboxymuconolactone decarboxylase family protein [Dehalococcoidia bacterium]|nr:carboxymuconolactone decarboxylase family protein [Dehalococcoidia bacterium]
MTADRRERATEVRRAVLGTSVPANPPADDTAAAFSDAALDFVWGTIWARDVISRRDRSIATLSMLTALNRPHELRIHVQVALNNGLMREEILEILLHASVYCGFPAAVDAMRIAREVFAETAS